MARLIEQDLEKGLKLVDAPSRERSDQPFHWACPHEAYHRYRYDKPGGFSSEDTISRLLEPEPSGFHAHQRTDRLCLSI